MMDGCFKNTPNNSELKFYKTSRWLLGHCRGWRWGGGDQRKVRKWLKYLSCLKERKCYIYVKKLWKMNRNTVKRM